MVTRMCQICHQVESHSFLALFVAWLAIGFKTEIQLEKYDVFVISDCLVGGKFGYQYLKLTLKQNSVITSVEVLVDVALQPFDIYVMLVADTYKTISFAPGLVSVKFVHNTSKNKHVSLFTKRNLVLAPCLSLH